MGCTKAMWVCWHEGQCANFKPFIPLGLCLNNTKFAVKIPPMKGDYMHTKFKVNCTSHSQDTSFQKTCQVSLIFSCSSFCTCTLAKTTINPIMYSDCLIFGTYDKGCKVLLDTIFGLYASNNCVTIGWPYLTKNNFLIKKIRPYGMPLWTKIQFLVLYINT